VQKRFVFAALVELHLPEMNSSPASQNQNQPVEIHDGATLCPICRHVVLIETNFCPTCGTSVDAPGVAAVSPPARVKSSYVFELLVTILLSIFAVSNAVYAIIAIDADWTHVVKTLYFSACAFILARRWSAARMSRDLAN
jgi:hypothetical protein